MADLVGQQLGNYRLSHLLGQGGYAEVYLGEHIHLNTLAAIKVLHTRLASMEEVESFKNEGRTIASLIHPHIVRVFDFDVQHDIPFMVMDFAPNGNLRKRHSKGERLSLAAVVPYVNQAAEALQYAHDQNLIHRDIKPENMLLGRNEEVLLSDFGTALVAQTTGYQRTLQEVVGTVSYMAPEQFQGKARPASDQYALAVVVYEWLCGELPFYGQGTQIAIQHSMTPPPSLHERVPTIAPLVDQVIMKALAKDHHQRFPRVQDFAAALEQASRAGESFYSEPTLASPLPPPMPNAAPGEEAYPLHPQSMPVISPAVKPSPLAMDTVTSEVAHAPALVSPLPSNQPPPQYEPFRQPSLPYAPISTPPFQQAPVRSYRRRLWPILLLLLALLLLLGGGIVWYVASHISGTSSLPGQQSLVYPNTAGNYNGTLHNTNSDVTTSMAVSIQQNQGHISGQFTVGHDLQGNGPFSGTVDTAYHIRFTVQGYKGNAPLFFNGIIQSDGTLEGDYCSLGANSQCNSQAGGSGTWKVARNSSITPQNSTPTTGDEGNNNSTHKGKKKH